MRGVDPHDQFAAAIARQRNGGVTTAPATAKPAAAPAAAATANVPAGPDDIELGLDEHGKPIRVDLSRLMEGRALIQGVSGAGKSWTLRRLLEQTASRVQQLVIDPEGEFRGLAEQLGHLYVEGHTLGDAALTTLARRAREHRLSMVIDLSDLQREEQMQAVASFFSALVECPPELWNTALVAVDEAHLFAPFGGDSLAASSVRKSAIGATTDLMSRGRKRGLAGVLATQRLARLAKSVASEVQNYFIGLNTLDIDVKRAAEMVGWSARKASDRLPLLKPGQFVTVGPAFSQSPAIVSVGGVKTKHAGAAPKLTAPIAIDAKRARELVNMDELVQASVQPDIEGEDSSRRQDGTITYRGVRMFIRNPLFPLAAQIYEGLCDIFPKGSALDDIAKHLKVKRTEIAAAVALLDTYGILEVETIDQRSVARISKGALPAQADD